MFCFVYLNILKAKYFTEFQIATPLKKTEDLATLRLHPHKETNSTSWDNIRSSLDPHSSVSPFYLMGACVSHPAPAPQKYECDPCLSQTFQKEVSHHLSPHAFISKTKMVWNPILGPTEWRTNARCRYLPSEQLCQRTACWWSHHCWPTLSDRSDCISPAVAALGASHLIFSAKIYTWVD